MDELSQAFLGWGLLLLIGFTATQFVFDPFIVNVLWVVLSVVGQLLLARAAMWNWSDPLWRLWSGVIAGGVLLSFFLGSGYFFPLGLYLASIWLIVMGVPLILSGKWFGWSLLTKIGVAWIVLAVPVALVDVLVMYQWLVTGLITGLPMLYLAFAQRF